MTGIQRDELADIKQEEMSSRARALLGPIPCLLGIHNWGPPKAVTSVVLHGEEQDDGDWDHWTDDPTKKVTQHCRSCSRYRDREDLDWQQLSDIQAGRTEPNT